MATWKRDFASGLIILVPLLVTLIFLAWIYGYLTRIPVPIDPLAEMYGIPVEPLRVLFTLTIFILMVFSVGYLMRTALGSIIEAALDDLMNQLPGLRVIYNASKMAIETAVSGTGELQKPVRLEVWDGLRMTAFKTGNKAPDGREILFMPTAPNITTGFVIEVEEDRYVEIDDSVEDALTRLLSAGFGEKEDKSVSELFEGTEHGGSGEVSYDAITESVPDKLDPTNDDSGDDEPTHTAENGGDSTSAENETTSIDGDRSDDASPS